MFLIHFQAKDSHRNPPANTPALPKKDQSCERVCVKSSEGVGVCTVHDGMELIIAEIRQTSAGAGSLWASLSPKHWVIQVRLSG